MNIAKGVRIAKQLARNHRSAERVNHIVKHHVNPDAKHRVSQAAKQAHRQTQRQAYLLQLRFRQKSKAATQLSFSGVRLATAIYRDIYYKKRPTAVLSHRFIKVLREASRTPSQSAQARFSIV